MNITPEIFEVKFSLNGEAGLKSFEAYVYGLDNDKAAIFLLEDKEQKLPIYLIGRGMPEYQTIVDAKIAFDEAKLNAKLYSILDMKEAFKAGEALGAGEIIHYDDFDDWRIDKSNKKKRNELDID